jgi:cytochrome oxidase Cu insertion factor (SCO1/SenC/PrrC family)
MDLQRRIALWKVVVWLTAALAATTACAVPKGGQATVPPPAGQPAPGFDLSLLSGKKVALKEFRGKAVLIVFWQSG